MARKKKNDQGWIKLFRKIRDNPIWCMPTAFDCRSAWIDLLLSANHEDRAVMLRSGRMLVVRSGQLFTSKTQLASKWRWSRNRVDRYFRLLAEHGMVSVSGASNGTLVTIENWAFYQDGRATNGASDGATGGASDGATGGAQTRIIYKNDNNKNVIQEIAAAPQMNSRGDVLE